MTTERPINLDISTIHLPITALASITHRVSGIILLFVTAIALWGLKVSLTSEQGFNQVVDFLAQGWVKTLVWLMLTALFYHLIAGVRHLIMDMGIGESLEGGRRGAKIVIALAILVSLNIAYWLEIWVW